MTHYATGTDLMPMTGSNLFTLTAEDAQSVVLVVQHAGDWSDWKLVSQIVHGKGFHRASAILDMPTAHISWSSRGIVMYADRDSSAPEIADVGLASDCPAPRHSELARELRDNSGLSAAVLGDALGVSREQFQRWMSGRPISDPRHGQLAFLHTVARELVRKLGDEGARIWWQTPGADGVAPKELLQRRLLDRVHMLVVEEADRMGHGRPALLAMTVEPFDAEMVEDNEDSWSPYEAG